jgi:hypothetical protein
MKPRVSPVKAGAALDANRPTPPGQIDDLHGRANSRGRERAAWPPIGEERGPASARLLAGFYISFFVN